MKKANWMILAVVIMAASGCTVQKELVPTGGSRADGTVTLSYDYGMFEKPQVDMAQGELAAQQRCAAWGYTGAEPFGGSLNRCEAADAYGNCTRTLVTMTYQCTGTPPSSR